MFAVEMDALSLVDARACVPDPEEVVRAASGGVLRSDWPDIQQRGRERRG
jgi:hypothetical protein